MQNARSVPKNTGRSGRYKKHYVLAVEFVAAARFLGGQRFVLPRPKMIHYFRPSKFDKGESLDQNRGN
jgi:hypothetical protein